MSLPLLGTLCQASWDSLKEVVSVYLETLFNQQANKNRKKKNTKNEKQSFYIRMYSSQFPLTHHYLYFPSFSQLFSHVKLKF